MNPVLLCIALLVPAEAILAQTDLKHNLTNVEKVAGLSQLWSEAKYNFVYFDQAGVDWDSAYHAFLPRVIETQNTWEYYLLLMEFSALLKDGHTDVSLPGSLFLAPRYTPLIFSLSGVEYFVTNVILKDRGEIAPGAVLKEIEGAPVHRWLRDNIYKYISASTDHERMRDAINSLYLVLPDTVQTLNMTFEDTEGRRFAYPFRYRSNRKGWSQPFDPWSRYRLEWKGDIANIRINTFADDSVITDFRNDLPDIVERASGVVLDIRNNGGGNTTIGAQILMHFTGADSLMGSAWRTRRHEGAYKVWGWYYRQDNPEVTSRSREISDFYRKSLAVLEDDYWYDGGYYSTENATEGELRDKPVVVLAGNGTASAAEDFLVMVRQLPDRKIPVLGQNSFGSTGAPLPLSLPGGGSARICAKRDTFMDGTDFVGYGIEPDIEIIPAIADVISNRDVVLERAWEILSAQ